ncbi:MAG: GIY-YIG nuclease family protein [Patescibacteria group bacterium]
MYYIYILQSARHNKFYIGVSKDLKHRLDKHNSGSSRSTKPYQPWQIIYTEKFASKNEAYKREFYLKHPQGYQKKLKIIKSNKIRSNGGIA